MHYTGQDTRYLDFARAPLALADLLSESWSSSLANATAWPSAYPPSIILNPLWTNLFGKNDFNEASQVVRTYICFHCNKCSLMELFLNDKRTTFPAQA